MADKQKEYLKIQLLADYRQASTNVPTSLTLGAMIGFLVALATLNFQGTLSYLAYLVGVSLVGGVLGIILWFALRGYRNEMFSISKMIEAVDKGESLPTLEEMMEGKKPKEPPSTEQPSKPPEK